MADPIDIRLFSNMTPRRSVNGGAIRAARRRWGGSQEALAAAARLSVVTVRNAELGIASDRTLSAIASALGVDPAELR